MSTTTRFVTFFVILATLTGWEAHAKPRSPSDRPPTEQVAPPVPEAQPYSISALAQPDKTRLGEPFSYLIEIRDANEVEYLLPSTLSLGPAFEVLGTQVSFPKSASGEKITRFAIQATIFDLGEKSIADIELGAKASGKVMRLTVHGPKITGLGDLKEDSNELGAILPPVDVMVPRYTALWIAGAVLLLFFLSLLLYRFWKRRPGKTRTAALPLPPPVPAHQKAWQALQSLQQENLAAQGQAKEHFFRISEIMREYLGARYGFLALDMTTEELLSTISRIPTPGLPLARFQSFCNQGDLIKYAKQPAGVTDCKSAIEEAFQIVNNTCESMSTGTASLPGAAQK